MMPRPAALSAQFSWERLGVQDMETADRAGQCHIQVVRAARVGRHDPGRLHDNDSVEFQALGEARGQACQPGSGHRVGVLAEQRGVQAAGDELLADPGTVAVSSDDPDRASLREAFTTVGSHGVG